MFEIPKDIELDEDGHKTLIRARDALISYEVALAVQDLQRHNPMSTQATIAKELMLAVALAHCNYPNKAFKTVVASMQKNSSGMEEGLFLRHQVFKTDLQIRLGQMKSALEATPNALKKSDELKLDELYLETILQEAVAYSLLGNHKESLTRIENAQSLSGMLERSSWVPKVLAAKSACLYRMGDYVGSLENAKDVVQLSTDADPLTRGTGYRRMGIASGAMGRFYDALEEHRSALPLFNKVACIPAQINGFLSLADTYLKIEEISHASHFTQKAKKLAEDGDNPVLQCFARERLCKLSIATGKFDAAVLYSREQLNIASEQVRENLLIRADAELISGISSLFDENLKTAYRHLCNAAITFEAAKETSRFRQAVAYLSKLEPTFKDSNELVAGWIESMADSNKDDKPANSWDIAFPHLMMAYRRMNKRKWEKSTASLFNAVDDLVRHDYNLDAVLELLLFGRMLLTHNIEAALPVFEKTLTLSGIYGFHGIAELVFRELWDRCGDGGKEIAVNYTMKKVAFHGGYGAAEFTKTDCNEESMIGNCAQLSEIRAEIERFAPTEIRVMILGESGTGKELVANSIHNMSTRRKKGFAALNCAALPASVVESELFGYVEGAFTGAGKDRDGLIRAANGGTLFLDEIGELPLETQPKLLRFLQENEVVPVGSDQSYKVDVRVISATNRNLEKDVAEGKFRSDLFYRLNQVALTCPRLSDRGMDIIAIAQSIINRSDTAKLKGIFGLTRTAAEALLSHHWPGNVRELGNVIEVAIVRCTTNQITVDDLKLRSRGTQQSKKADNDFIAMEEENPSEMKSSKEVLFDAVVAALTETRGVKKEAAQILGIHRNTMTDWVRKDPRLLELITQLKN